jgi:hypothetical protein
MIQELTSLGLNPSPTLAQVYDLEHVIELLWASVSSVKGNNNNALGLGAVCLFVVQGLNN